MTKWLCVIALFAPFTLIATGCGDDKAGQMATDSELQEYGENAAKGTGLEGLKMKDGPKSE